MLIRSLLRALCLVCFKVHVRGEMTNFGHPRLLIIANHGSFLDGLLLGLFLPINPVFIVNTGISRNFWARLFLSQIDYLPVDPTNPMAIKTVINLIESGRPVAIFPEGRITVTGSLMKVYEGPAFVAAKTGAVVVPVRLDGSSYSLFSRMGGHYPRHWFPKITISIQSPTSIKMPDAPTAKLRRHKSGEAMRRIMQDMLFRSRPQQTLYTAMVDAMHAFGRKRRVIEDIRQVEYSFGDLLKMMLMLGRVVAKHSAPGETIGILLPNLASTIAITIATSALGRIPAMLNFTSGAEGIASACIAARIQTIFTSREFIETARLSGTLAKLQNMRVLYLEDLRKNFGWMDKAWLLWKVRLPRSAAGPQDPERTGVVLFTSGSEGKPKGVALSHRALLANIAQVRAVIDLSVEDKVLNALPVFHSFGLTGGALLPLLSGARLFLYPSPLHYSVIPEIAYDRNCTVLFGTSTFLGNYAKAAHPYDFYRLRYVIAGAEKLSDAIRNDWFEKFGIRILEGYGATETAPVLAVNTPMAYRSGTVGQFLPGIEYQLLPVPGIDRGGLLNVKGPNLMSGYLRFEKPGVLEPPASDTGVGWYATGDIVEVDADGFVSILGRVKRFAKVAGEMISLEVVEKLAIAASPSAQHAASTQPDAQRGENIVLFTTDRALTREKIQEAARNGGHPEIAVPRKIAQVETLPLLGTGKVDYVSLKKLAESA